MAGSIPPLRPGSRSSQSPDEATSGHKPGIQAPDRKAPGGSEAVSSRPENETSIKSRLLTRLGLRKATAQGVTTASRFTAATGSPPAASQGLDPTDPGNEARAIEQAIRARLDTLPDTPAQRYRQALESSLQATDPQRQLGILKMLEENVTNASLLHVKESSSVRSWKALAQTSLGMNFERNVSDLSRKKEDEMNRLIDGIARLPTGLSEQYRALLSDILVFGKPIERETLLSDLARTVAAHLKTLD